ncbi:MAG: efflux RND transporter periplasmic adaptor subunit [Hydrogenimonas sp.]|nr:efflux RND transporter periplasmic adaptor subunit [Hydrogenimonas sp.]
MRKFIVATLFTLLPIIASAETVKGDTSMVKTQKVETTEKVYMGSFLAVGYLPNDAIYRIDAPIEGVVEMVNVRIYEPVKRSKKLFVIKGPKLLELESEFIDTLIEMEYYENEVKRLEPLYKAAVVAKKRYLEAKNMLAKFETKSMFYYHLLLEWGLKKSEVDSIVKSKKPLPKITIISPIDGIVSDMNIYPKMYAERGTHLMTILNPDRVHYEVALPLKITKSLKPGMRLFVDDKEAVIESISATVNSRTQTVAVHLKPIRGNSAILPDEKRNIKLYWPKKAFSLPANSVIEYGGKEVVFVKTGSGFKPIFVTVLGRSSDKVYVISSNLPTDANIAVSGVIALKGAMEAQND